MTKAKGILIVEDDPDIRDILTEILSDEGHHVVQAHNGQEGLNQLHAAGPFAVVLLDLMMPGMNGWEFRSAQQQDPAIADVPVVVLSGDINIPEQAESLQAAGYLAKPINLADLLRVVDRFAAEQ